MFFEISLGRDYYMRSGGKFGAVFQNLNLSGSELRDGEELNRSLIKNLEFHWDSKKTNKKLLADLQINSPGFRLISEKFKTILEKYNDEQNYSFFPVIVTKDDVNYQYYILHFNKIFPDAIDEKNLYLESANVALKLKNIEGQKVFNIDVGYSLCFYVSKEVLFEIKKEKITGIRITEIKVS